MNTDIMPTAMICDRVDRYKARRDAGDDASWLQDAT